MPTFETFLSFCIDWSVFGHFFNYLLYNISVLKSCITWIHFYMVARRQCGKLNIECSGSSLNPTQKQIIKRQTRELSILWHLNNVTIEIMNTLALCNKGKNSKIRIMKTEVKLENVIVTWIPWSEAAYPICDLCSKMNLKVSSKLLNNNHNVKTIIRSNSDTYINFPGLIFYLHLHNKKTSSN